MARSFIELVNMLEAAPPLPPPGGGMGGPPPPGLGGGMPPMPPPPMGGGLGGGLGGPPMGGGDPSMQPIPVKVIDAMDVWEILKKSLDSMDQYPELTINYEREEDTKARPPKKKSSLLM